MLESITIENFRGIEKCRVDGLGRVNLIIGKNNAGKTAVMEAVTALSSKHGVAEALGQAQELRHFNAPDDFAGFWLPLFREQDAVRGLVLSCRDPRGEARVVFTQDQSSGASLGARHVESRRAPIDSPRNQEPVPACRPGGGGGGSAPRRA